MALFVAIPLTVYVVMQQQNIRGRAEKSTILTLTPPNQNAERGQEVSLNVNIDPGLNYVNYIKFAISYDPNKFSADANSFTIDSASDLEVIDGPLVSSGSFILSLGVGNNPTKVIRTAQKIGTLKLNVLQNALGGISPVTFNENQIQIRSIGFIDSFNENVLSSTIPANITINSVAEVTPTPTLSITPSVSPTPNLSITPTPGFCPKPETVTNVRVTCPDCLNSEVTPTPTPEIQPES